MQKLLGIVVLGLLIVSVSSYADDKQYFRIEGLTIGESLLKYMSKEKIIENDMPLWKDKKFLATMYTQSSLTYDGVAVDYKPNDPNYIIQGITGLIYYENDIEGCYKKQDEIDNKMSSKFFYIKRKDWGVLKLDFGGDGATYRPITYDLKKGSRMAVDCYFYTDPTFTHNLKVHMSTKIMKNYLNLLAEPAEN